MVGRLNGAQERGCQGVLFAGEYDDSGWGVSDGGEAEAGLDHPWPTTSTTTPTTTAPHKCPTWGIDQPHHNMPSSPPVTRSQHGAQGRSSGQGFLNSVSPIGNKRARVTNHFLRKLPESRRRSRVVYRACDASQKTMKASRRIPHNRTTNPPTLPNLKFKYPNFGSSTVPHHKCT